MPVPDSGVCAALGYAEESRHPVRDRPGPQPLRRAAPSSSRSSRSAHFGVKVKLNPVRSVLEGKRVVLVDDSIVRGTTSRKIVRMLGGRRRRRSTCGSAPADDLAVLLRHRHPAAHGADRRHAHGRGDRRVRRRPTRLGYLSLEGHAAASVNSHRAHYCTSCYTGRYPVPFPRRQADQVQLPPASWRTTSPARRTAMIDYKRRRRRHRRAATRPCGASRRSRGPRSRPASCRRSARSAACSGSSPAGTPSPCSSPAPTASAPS